ncbi:hypothetical protein ANN_01897 [Periplaneta americana]|uniref:Uncharacterized protein n=1 Tax=Periplaneta americana TaxID=6978 RepID=A0ABQ8TWK1_PERAM|nr:hypothetical protein ANN_01897 [Periplaneta americana]
MGLCSENYLTQTSKNSTTSTAPPAPPVASNEVAPQAPRFDDASRNEIPRTQDYNPQVDGLVVQWTQTAPSAHGHLVHRISQCDFFLWSFVKNNVYIPPLPAMMAELRKCINTAIRNITQDMLHTPTTTPTIITTTTTVIITSITITTTIFISTSTSFTSLILATSNSQPSKRTPKTTANPAAGVLDDFSFLNVLVSD